MTLTPPPVAGTAPDGDDDAARWREAARLRSKHSGWIMLWPTDLGQYRAYPRRQDRRRTIVAPAAPDGLAALITWAEQASPGRRAAAAGMTSRP